MYCAFNSQPVGRILTTVQNALLAKGKFSVMNAMMVFSLQMALLVKVNFETSKISD